MFSKLFKSTARRKLFEIFLDDSRQKYYLRQLADHIDYSPGSLQRELSGLITDGYLMSEMVGNMRFFTLNKKHPLIGEIKKYLEEHPQIAIKRTKNVFKEAKKSGPIRLEIR